jgi:hypothetical protein
VLRYFPKGIYAVIKLYYKALTPAPISKYEYSRGYCIIELKNRTSGLRKISIFYRREKEANLILNIQFPFLSIFIFFVRCSVWKKTLYLRKKLHRRRWHYRRISLISNQFLWWLFGMNEWMKWFTQCWW